VAGEVTRVFCWIQILASWSYVLTAPIHYYPAPTAATKSLSGRLQANRASHHPWCLLIPKTNTSVSTYINNEIPSQAPFNPGYIDQAFDLLIRCHQLDIKTSNINYHDHIEHYWQIIEARSKPLNPVLVKQRKPMQSTLESLINRKTPTGLCHHDPVTANFIGTPNRLYLIDWEYAATGLQIIDYAALATEWQIDDAFILERTKVEPELLTKAKVLYRYLCLLWENSVA